MLFSPAEHHISPGKGKAKTAAMKITIKTLKQEAFQIEVDVEKDTVRTLKEKFFQESKQDYPVERQRLIYLGKIMEDDLPLSHYSLDDKKFVVVMNKKPTTAPAEPAASSSATAPAESKSSTAKSESGSQSEATAAASKAPEEKPKEQEKKEEEEKPKEDKKPEEPPQDDIQIKVQRITGECEWGRGGILKGGAACWDTFGRVL